MFNQNESSAWTYCCWAIIHLLLEARGCTLMYGENNQAWMGVFCTHMRLAKLDLKSKQMFLPLLYLHSFSSSFLLFGHMLSFVNFFLLSLLHTFVSSPRQSCN